MTDVFESIERHPGKFEGNPLFIAMLWERAAEGFSDDTLDDGETPISVFKVDSEFAAEFPGTKEGTVICIWEDDNGFVYYAIHTAEGFAKIEAELLAVHEDGQGGE